jgi:hypothetical protein
MGIMQFLFMKDITGYSYVSLVTSKYDSAVNVRCQHVVTLSDFRNIRLYSAAVRQTGCITKLIQTFLAKSYLFCTLTMCQ